MHDEKYGALARDWFPVARSEEVVARHIVQAQLLGQELAIWRDDAGHVNVWENRCPHRGVRLSIGLNAGNELRCRYHGWRYASRTGQCTFIPAHPSQKPASAIRTTSYHCTEQYGFVWVNLESESNTKSLGALGIQAWTTLRSIFVQAPTSLVMEILAAKYDARGSSATFEAPGPRLVPIAELTLETLGQPDDGDSRLIVLLQPMNDNQTLMHGILNREVVGADRLALLRLLNQRLNGIRDVIENASAHRVE